MNKKEKPSIPGTLTLAKCQEYSGYFERIVISLNRKEFDGKFSKIFIDINNKLHEIFLTGEYKEGPITKLLSNYMDESLSTLSRQLESKETNNIDILDSCVSFKFLYYNMENLFPNGKYADKVLLDDIRAEDWWCSRFSDSLFIPAPTFWNEVSKCFPLIDNISNFLNSVNFTKNQWFSEYVNKSSFNIFVRFYGGWSNFATDWCEIYYHPGHMVLGSSEHAEQELLKLKSDLKKYRSPSKSFIFCLNWRCDEGLWNLIYIDDHEDVKNNLVKSDQLLIELKKEHLYLYPRGKEPINVLNVSPPGKGNFPDKPSSSANDIEKIQNFDIEDIEKIQNFDIEEPTYCSILDGPITNPNVETAITENVNLNVPQRTRVWLSLPSIPID